LDRQARIRLEHEQAEVMAPLRSSETRDASVTTAGSFFENNLPALPPAFVRQQAADFVEVAQLQQTLSGGPTRATIQSARTS